MDLIHTIFGNLPWWLILLFTASIVIKAWIGKPSHYTRIRKARSGIKELLFCQVLLEKRQGDNIPDCIGVTGNGKQLFIGVYVAHKVDEKKISKIVSMGCRL